MNSETSNAIGQDGEFDIRYFLSILRHRWPLIAVITVVITALAATYAYQATPRYQATVLIAPAVGDSRGAGGGLAAQYGGLAEMAGITIGGGGSSKDANLAYLTSRGLIESFIKDNELMPVLFPAASGAPEKSPSTWVAVNRFLSLLTVATDKKTGLTTVSVIWKDRELAVAWANKLVAKANSNLRQRAIQEARDSLGYLETELAKTSVVEVQQTIFRVMESQVKTMMMANVQEQFAFRVIDPAALMDENAFVQPKRLKIIVGGFAGGLILGVVLALGLGLLRRTKA